MRHIRNGKPLQLHQFANDWITATDQDGRPVVVSPRVVVVDEVEREIFERSREDRGVGHFWSLWELDERGRFLPKVQGCRPTRVRHSGL